MAKTFFGNDENEIESLCNEFISKYPKSTVLKAVDSFKWGNNTEDSTQVRDEVAKKFKLWILEGCPIAKAQKNADMVMEWGFNGQKSPRSIAENLEDFCDFISAWNKHENSADMQSLLAKNLRLRGIGIARSSKWLCFAAPKKFCIYDSRVSITLRSLGKGNGKTFPTVGRKKTKRIFDFPNPNFRNAEKMVIDYCKFLDLVGAIKSKYQMDSASNIEMGLFMLGDDPSIWRRDVTETT